MDRELHGCRKEAGSVGVDGAIDPKESLPFHRARVLAHALCELCIDDSSRRLQTRKVDASRGTRSCQPRESRQDGLKCRQNELITTRPANLTRRAIESSRSNFNSRRKKLLPFKKQIRWNSLVLKSTEKSSSIRSSRLDNHFLFGAQLIRGGLHTVCVTILNLKPWK